MRKKLFKLVITFVLLLGFTVVLAGCGESKISVQGITDEYIHVGNTAATSGLFADVGIPFNLAMEVVFDEYNASRAAGERKIKFTTYDDGFDGAQGLAFTKKLIEDDKIFAIVGHFGTETVDATIDYLTKSGVPMVYAATGVNSLFQEKKVGGNILPVQPIYSKEAEILVARVLSEKLFGATGDQALSKDGKIAVLYSNDEAGVGMKNGVEKELKAKNQNGRATYVSFTSDTASTAVATALNVKPEVIFLVANQAPSTAATKELRAQGNKAPVFTSYVNGAKVFTDAQVDKAAFDFNIFVNGWVDISDLSAAAPTAEMVGNNGIVVGINDDATLDIFLAAGILDEAVVNYIKEVDRGAGLAALAGFSADYWEFVKTMNNSSRTSGGYVTQALWANGYAMAGYVAAKTFVHLLEQVEDFEKLTYADFIKIAEKAPIAIPMAGTIDWTDGKRLGLTDLAMSKFGLNATGTAYTFNQILSIASKDEIYGK